MLDCVEIHLLTAFTKSITIYTSNMRNIGSDMARVELNRGLMIDRKEAPLSVMRATSTARPAGKEMRSNPICSKNEGGG